MSFVENKKIHMSDSISVVNGFVRVIFSGRTYFMTHRKFYERTKKYFYMMVGDSYIKTLDEKKEVWTYHISHFKKFFTKLIDNKIFDMDRNKENIFIFIPNYPPIALSTEAFERKFHGNFQSFHDGSIATSGIIYNEDQFIEKLDIETDIKKLPRIDSNRYETFIYHFHLDTLKIDCIPTHDFKILFGCTVWENEHDYILVEKMKRLKVI